MEKLKEDLKKYVPETISPLGMLCMIASIRETNRKLEYLKESYRDADKACREYSRKVLRSRSNNWLKMHGYPMRRKGI